VGEGGGKPEVTDLELEGFGQKEIAQFEVAMNDFLLVYVFKGVEKLRDVVPDL